MINNDKYKFYAFLLSPRLLVHTPCTPFFRIFDSDPQKMPVFFLRIFFRNSSFHREIFFLIRFFLAIFMKKSNKCNTKMLLV